MHEEGFEEEKFSIIYVMSTCASLGVFIIDSFFYLVLVLKLIIVNLLVPLETFISMCVFNHMWVRKCKFIKPQQDNYRCGEWKN